MFTKLLLDSFAQLHQSTIDASVWERAVTCMQASSTTNLDLLIAQDAAYQGLVDLGRSGGTEADPWGEGPNFLEWNPVPLSDDNEMIPGAADIVIGEPCNLMSCFSFYRQTFALCEYKQAWTLTSESVSALVQMSVAHAVGGILYHASQMDLGLAIGKKNAGILIYVAFQDALSPLASDSYTPVLHELSDTRRPRSALELAVDANLLFVNERASEWATALPELDAPSSELGLSATICTVMYLAFASNTASALCQGLGGNFVSGDDLTFLTDNFDPEIRRAFDERMLSPSPASQRRLLSQFLGVFLKMIFGLRWSETEDGQHLHSRLANQMAADSMPAINQFSNWLTGFDRSSDPAVQTCTNVYPGDAACRRTQPHSKFEETFANALMDIILLLDSIKQVLMGENLESIRPLLDRAVEHCFEQSNYLLNWAAKEETLNSFELCLLPMMGTLV